MTTELDTVQGRVLTFKNASIAGKAVKWPHRQLSMIGMARAFYYYEPQESVKDRVVCICCGNAFANWKTFKGNPLFRHAEGDSECVVAHLARIGIKLNQGIEVDCSQVKETFLKTFLRDSLVASMGNAEQLAANGYILLPAAMGNKATVGCVGCICFPNTLESQKHGRKCPVSALINAKSTNRQARNPTTTSIYMGESELEPANDEFIVTKDKDSIMRNSDGYTIAGTFAGSNLALKRPYKPQFQFTPISSIREASEVFSSDKSLPQPPVSLQPSESANELTSSTCRLTAVERCAELFNQLQIESNSSYARLRENQALKAGYSEEFMNQMEILAISILEKTHVIRIQLISEETERVVSRILSS